MNYKSAYIILQSLQFQVRPLSSLPLNIELRMIFFMFKERVSGILISIKLQTIEKSMFNHPSHVSSIQYNVYCNFLRLSRKRNYQVSPKYAFNFDRNIENIREVTFLTSVYVNARHFNCVFNKGF